MLLCWNLKKQFHTSNTVKEKLKINVKFKFWNLYMEIEKLNLTIINGTFVKGFNFYYLNIIQALSLKIFVLEYLTHYIDIWIC